MISCSVDSQDAGNKALAAQDFATAVSLYSAALAHVSAAETTADDATAQLASALYCNRAAALLKLSKWAQAREPRACSVVHRDDAGTADHLRNSIRTARSRAARCPAIASSTSERPPCVLLGRRRPSYRLRSTPWRRASTGRTGRSLCTGSHKRSPGAAATSRCGPRHSHVTLFRWRSARDPARM